MSENKLKDKSSLKAASSSVSGSSSKNGSRGVSTSSISASELIPPVNVVLEWIMNAELEKLVNCFDDATDPNHDSIGFQISQRSLEDGRTPLEWAALLGHKGILSELLKRGVDVNTVNEKGYSAAHFAAAWGQVDCLRELVNNGADVELKNFKEESPRDIAKRYAKYPCIDYLDWEDAKKTLKELLLTVKDQVGASDKLKVLTKEEKSGISSMIAEQLGWLEKVTDDTPTAEFIEHKQIFDDYAQPILGKLPDADNKGQGPKSLKKTK